jgi:hypothetical protein
MGIESRSAFPGFYRNPDRLWSRYAYILGGIHQYRHGDRDISCRGDPPSFYELRRFIPDDPDDGHGTCDECQYEAIYAPAIAGVDKWICRLADYLVYTYEC